MLALRAEITFEGAYRFYCLFQPEYFLLEEMECPGFSAVAGKGRRARAVDAVHPVFQLEL